jgi:hypothetical protein
MKLLILFAFISIALNAADLQDEANLHLAAVKEKDVEKQVLNSSLFKDCKDAAEAVKDAQQRNQQIRECFGGKIDSQNDEEIQNLAQNFDLNSFDVLKSQDSKEVRNYFKERLNVAIYGPNYHEEKLKKLKIVDQRTYLELYKTQLGKNILLDVSTYCLENLRDKNSKSIAPACNKNPKGQKWEGCFTTDKEGKKAVNFPAGGADSFWRNLTEVTYDPNTSSDEIEKISKQDFERGAEYLNAKFQLCSLSINKMCQRYECNNTVTTASDPETIAECSTLNSNWKPNSATDDNTTNNEKYSLGENKTDGRIACTVMKKLRAYRKAIISTGDLEAEFDKLKDKQNFITNVSQYSGKGQGEKSIDEITSISSKEITENAKIQSIQGSENKAKEFKEDCESNPNFVGDCSRYVIDETKIANIEVEFEAATALKLKEIESLKNSNNLEQLEKYLLDNGMNQQAEKLAKNELSQEEITEIIKNKFKAERMAVLNNLKEQLNRRSSAKSDAVLSANIESDIKDKKNRLDNIFHYSNIITSFLEIEDSQGNISKNRNSLDIERQGMQNFGNQASQSGSEDYFIELSKDAQENSSAGSATNVDLGIIDLILGN